MWNILLEVGASKSIEVMPQLVHLLGGIGPPAATEVVGVGPLPSRWSFLTFDCVTPRK